MAAFCIAIVVLPLSLVGLTETILSQENLDNLTDSTSHKNAEAPGQCISNIVRSSFSGMAGCNRLSTFSSGVNQIRTTMLACVMIMTKINTSK